MNELFPSSDPKQDMSFQPLAERIRPRTIDEIYGQEHLVGDGAPLRMFVQRKQFHSIIFWGPPGTGKTTMALMIAEYADTDFIRISAVEAGVKEVREVISKASQRLKSGKRTLLFIDEIHRFNKSQQDALLHAVENGIIILIGATTENPSFEVNSALLSRCQVYKLKSLSEEQILQLIDHALEKDVILKAANTEIEDKDFLVDISGGDARTALNAIDLAFKLAEKSGEKTVLTKALFQKALQQKTTIYDKKGEEHYDTISAFIKSMRGSDPDAALFWLAKMLEGGEDPKFIARRLIIFASEDIGNADTYAVTLAVTTFRAVEVIGMPECRINLAQAVTYLASCPKSNAAYIGINQAIADVKKGADVTVPMHLRNAPTKFMKNEGYGKGYKYPHDFPFHFVQEHYFPDSIKYKQYYVPGEFGKEKVFLERLKLMWPDRFEE